jgi:hypothetical protein
VRLLGVWVLIGGIEELITLVEVRFGMASPFHTQMSAYLFHAAVSFAVGMYLLAGGPVLTTFAFKPDAETDSEQSTQGE